MKYSKYDSPLIQRASQELDKLRNDPNFASTRRDIQHEFTNQHNYLMKIVRAEENRIAYRTGDWKSGREFESLK